MNVWWMNVTECHGGMPQTKNGSNVPECLKMHMYFKILNTGHDVLFIFGKVFPFLVKQKI